MRNERYDRGRTEDYRDRPKKNWLFRFVTSTIVLLGCAAALAYYAWNLRREHSSSAGQASSCATELTALKGQTATLTEQLQNCSKTSTGHASEKQAQAASLATLSNNLSATKAELEELRKQRAESSKRLAAFRDLTQKLRKMIDSGKLDVVIRNGQMMVKLPAAVLFASGSADLSREGELALADVAQVLKQFPDRTFMVIGHTDNLPLENAETKAKFGSNWELSTARAVNVTRFLVDARLNPHNVIAAGHAEFDPVGRNTTEEGRQTNRRIEIVLIPNIEELPPMPPG
jgi:chemotaxis protein MotB